MAFVMKNLFELPDYLPDDEVMFQLSRSLSINTGIAFSYKIGFALAEKVRLEQNTS